MDAFLRKHQPLNRTPTHEMFLDDFVHISGLHKSIPDLLRIDDHRGTMFTLSQTSGFVDADSMLQTSSIGFLL